MKCSKPLSIQKGGRIGFNKAPPKYTKESPVVIQAQSTPPSSSKKPHPSVHNSFFPAQTTSIPSFILNPDAPPSKRGYQESPPTPIDEQGMPMVAPNGDPDDPDPDPDPSSSKSCSSRSRKKAKPHEVDDDVTMDGSIDQRSTRSSRAAKTKAEKEEESELRMRHKPYIQRQKFDSSLKWNGHF